MVLRNLIDSYSSIDMKITEYPKHVPEVIIGKIPTVLIQLAN